MSQAVTDLPDPLQPMPALNSSSPDDLLSKMADEAIDKLMADADKGQHAEAAAPPPPMNTVAADMDALPPAEAPKPAPATTEPSALASATTEASPPAATATVADASAPAGHAEPPASSATAPAAERQAADVKALLEEPVAEEKTPAILLPLKILNAPLAHASDTTRRFVGILGIATLVPAICAIVYVIFLKHR